MSQEGRKQTRPASRQQVELRSDLELDSDLHRVQKKGSSLHVAHQPTGH